MDPHETLRLIDACKSANSLKCVEMCEHLRRWIAMGGFHPDWTKYPKGTRRYRKLFGLGEDLR